MIWQSLCHETYKIIITVAIEKSYYSLSDFVLLKWDKVIKAVPKLKINKGIKDVNFFVSIVRIWKL